MKEAQVPPEPSSGSWLSGSLVLLVYCSLLSLFSWCMVVCKETLLFVLLSGNVGSGSRGDAGGVMTCMWLSEA